MRSSQEKFQPLRYRDMSKSRLYLISTFRKKYDYFLHYLVFFGQETEQGQKSKRQNQNLAYSILATTVLINFL